MSGLKQQARVMDAVLAEQQSFRRPYSCGHCGERFSSKNAKARHKASCSPKQNPNSMGQAPERNDDENAYGFLARAISTPELRARAKAEWDAMDWQGRLPTGWKYEPEQTT